MDYRLVHYNCLRDMQDCIMYTHVFIVCNYDVMFNMVSLDTDCEQVACKHLFCFVLILWDYGNSWTSQSWLGEAEFGDYHEGGFL